ncbi:MAG: extracellular solute-binding protein, partial [Rhizobiales bacterium]|nr:extracellular solute-binding protein [Hyphomicrobiales bacterium]
MKLRHALLAFAAATILGGRAYAANLSIVLGSTGKDEQVMRELLDKFEKDTGNKVQIVPMPSSTTDQFGQYKLWLAAQNSDIDVYQTDVIWAPQLANQLLDLTDAMKDVAKDHFPAIIESQTVNGKLVALPFFTDAPALYYRKDLLDKYGKQ